MAFTTIPTRVANVDPASAADFNALMGNTQFNYDNKYFKTDFINSTAGVGDAGKPIVTNASGVLDPSFYTDNDSAGIYNIESQALLNCNLTVDQYTHISKPYIVTAAQVYFIDRWSVLYGGNGGTIDVDDAYAHTESGETAANGRKGFRVTSSGSAGSIQITQKLDTNIYNIIKGNTITISAWVTSNEADKVRIGIGSSFSPYHTGGGTAELLSLTLDGSTIASNAFFITITTTASVEVTDISGMSLNVGTERIIPVDHHNELMLCQWYYEVKEDRYLLHYIWLTANVIDFPLYFKPKRTTPQVSILNNTETTDFKVYNANGITQVTGFALGSTAQIEAENVATLRATKTSHGITEGALEFIAGNKIIIDAEI